MLNRKTAAILFIFLAASYFTVTDTNCWSKMNWIDIPLHFIGGIFSGLVFFLVFKKSLKNKTASFILIAVLSGAVAFGVFWEFFEWFLDYYYPNALKHQPNLNDTMADLALDLLGGLVVAAAVFKKVYNKNKQ